jgi:mono/diheme cytochrome c family protein
MCAMRGAQITARAVAGALIFSAVGSASAQSTSLVAKLRAQRSSPADLEVSGDLPGVPRNELRYLTRDDLLAISQAMTVSPDDGNFKSATEVRAVPLEDLARSLAVPAADMIIAICKDEYRGHYPRAYLAGHRPVLVVELNGTPLSDLPKESGAYDAGPYLIAHEHFNASSKLLAHDEPQIPWGVVRIDFRKEKDVFGPIAPRGGEAGAANVKAGFTIARENCFRCHNSLDEGGLKSGVNWTVLAAMAANSPDFFAAYVRDPQSKNPGAKMEGSPELGQAAMAELIAYFRAFAAASVEGLH